MTLLENNLHILWDDGLIDRNTRELGIVTEKEFPDRDIRNVYKAYSDFLAKDSKPLVGELKALMYDDVMRWAESAFQFRSLAYDKSGIADSKAYYNARIGIAKTLLEQAAYRLAGNLNLIFDATNYRRSSNIKEFQESRRREMDARIKAGRTTELETECDKPH